MGSNEQFSAGTGFVRLGRAFGYSYAGLRQALKNESAIRQEIAITLLMIPLALLLPVTALEKLLLAISMMQVVLVEFVNSAIEAVGDRVSLERHPLSGIAKDFGSAAVTTALVISTTCWAVIAGPVVWGWLAKRF